MASRRRPGRVGEPPARAPGDLPRADADPAVVARATCLRLLTAAPRTRRELADALAAGGISDVTARAVLDRFAEVGLVDDAAFAKAWVSSRQQGRGLARRALSEELRRRGVDAELVADAVGAVDPVDEEDAARRLVDRRVSAMSGLSAEAKQRRLMAMLGRRGYPAAVAARAVREALAAARSPAQT